MAINVPSIEELCLKAHLVEIYGLIQLGMVCFSFLNEQMKFQVVMHEVNKTDHLYIHTVVLS